MQLEEQSCPYSTRQVITGKYLALAGQMTLKHSAVLHALINSKLEHPPPPLPLGIWTFEDWIFQIPAPSSQNRVQNLISYPVLGLVCQCPTQRTIVILLS